MISQKTRSSLKITVGTILITFGTILIVALASGYNINFFSGEIFSTGLALLNTNPSGAVIKVNSKTLNQKTPYRLENVAVGDLTVEYYKSDYYDWKAKYLVRGGQVTFADYALLIPKNIEQKTIETQLKFSDIIYSQEKSKVFALVDNPGSLYEINKAESPKKIIDFPLNASLQQASTISDSSVNRDGSVVISKATYPDNSTSHFWVDTESAKIINLESALGSGVGNIQINPRNNREIYSLLEYKLRRLNVESKVALELPIKDCLAYNIDSDFIYALQKNTENGNLVLNRYDHNGNNKLELSSYQTSTGPWSIKSTRFDNQPIITLLDLADGNLSITRQVEGKYTSSSVAKSVSVSSFSPNGRFISFQQANKLRTIDIKFAERFNLDEQNASKLDWLTNFQILLTKNDGLYIVDYNGFNLIKLPPDSQADKPIKVATQINDKNVYILHNNKILYYTLQPKGGLINFR